MNERNVEIVDADGNSVAIVPASFLKHPEVRRIIEMRSELHDEHVRVYLRKQIADAYAQLMLLDLRISQAQARLLLGLGGGHASGGVVSPRPPYVPGESSPEFISPKGRPS